VPDGALDAEVEPTDRAEFAQYSHIDRFLSRQFLGHLAVRQVVNKGETHMPRPSKRALERVKVLTEAEQQAPAIEIRHLTLTFPDKPDAAEASGAEAKAKLGEAAPTAIATPATAAGAARERAHGAVVPRRRPRFRKSASA
jgi:hypothetical protein